MDYLNKGLKIDLGCGSTKKPGTIGLDVQAFPGVDVVTDVATKPLPFKDGSVDYVYSSHFLEHLTDLGPVFIEITRVCNTNAKLELWTPYAWSNLAFILDHKLFLTEDVYVHIGVEHPDFWTNMLGARWVLDEIRYMVAPDTFAVLKSQGISLEFALRHMINIAPEFGVYMTVRPTDIPTTPVVKRSYSFSRDGERFPLESHTLPTAASGGLLSEAIRMIAQRLIQYYIRR